jgi:DNA polymerase III subunit alpha
MVHLHVHSEHSLLDGLSRLKDLLAKCQEFKMPAMALTDHGAMYGSHKFYNLFHEAGVKPIIGCEVYMASRSRLDKEAVDKDFYHLLLLAKNYKGYQNLMKIVTLANTEGFYYKARADEELLEKYHEGIICSSACLGGKVSQLIMKGKRDEAKNTIDKYSQIFGEGNYYLEIQNHPMIKEVDEVNKELIKLSREHGLPLICTNDSHYTNKDDAEAQELLLCVQTQKTILEKNRPLSMIGSPDFYFKSPEEMEDEFKEIPEALKNTLKIAEMVDIQLPKTGFILPYYPIPEAKTADQVLREMCYDKVKSRIADVNDEVKTRIDYELDVIKTKGYSTYFLIVQDFVIWAKNQGIAVGPGRGSAAGSLVAFVLRITELNPLVFKLPFERFLNPSRPTPPDIDMDFADNRRDDVIKYVTEKYGKDKVAQIITFGTMESKQAIRDAARALGMPYSAGDRISKMIPPPHQGHVVSIKKAMEMNDDLGSAYKSEAETKRLLDLAMKLEGVTRHASTHAAGLIIADKELTEYTPLAREVKGERIVTQYDMYDLDKNVSENAIGLLKMDFLGLRNLTILQEAIKYVKRYKNIDIDLTKIPLDDALSYQTISKGETVGIFQLESPGMKNLAKNLRPTKINDLSAMIALYRPGPMEWIPEFVSSKENPEKIKYLHPDLESILGETYGIAVYQEQCMEIASKIAGYTLSEADNFRKAIGKKKPEIMKKEKEKFIDGCLKQKYSRDISEQIFQLIEKFAGYGFNKAHSASYGLIAYHTAYMKSHYPIEYMTAILTAENRATSGPLKEEKMSRLVSEVKRMGIPVLPPNINFSEIEFSIEGEEGHKSIRFGLSAIKNVGEAAMESIVNARNERRFNSFFDFIKRVDGQKVNKKTLESLIKAGALDVFGKRSSLLIAIEEVRKLAERKSKKEATGQDSLFGEEETSEENLNSENLPDTEEFTKAELLAFEKQFFGFYLSEHPATEKLLKAGENLFRLAEISESEHVGKKMKLCGLIVAVKRIFTKKDGSEMAFVTVDDMSARMELVVFPKTFELHKDKLFEDNVIIFVGKIDLKEEKINILIEDIESAP